MKIVYITTWFPTPCGIANFTSDLARAVEEAALSQIEWGVIACTVTPGMQYDARVQYDIEVYKEKKFIEAADFINHSPFDVVSIQHEFGIYGRKNHGEKVVELCEHINKPKVVTLHTVEMPSVRRYIMDDFALRKSIIFQLSNCCQSTVVMTENARENLITYYGIPSEKISVIPHGSHRFNVTASRQALLKKYQLPDQTLIFGTTGFISPYKGLEYQVEALYELNKEYPQVVLWICGLPHPKGDPGKNYYKAIKAKAKKLGLASKVIFTEAFFNFEELGEIFSLIDVYLNTNIGINQSSSGTLAFAMGMGKSIICTRFKHALETLAEERGILVPPRNARALYRAMKRMVENPLERKAMGEKVAAYSLPTLWSKVGHAYYNVFRHAILKRQGELT